MGQPLWGLNEVKWDALSKNYKIGDFYIAYADGKPSGCMALVDSDCYIEAYAGKLKYNVDVSGDEKDIYQAPESVGRVYVSDLFFLLWYVTIMLNNNGCTNISAVLPNSKARGNGSPLGAR